MAYEQRDNSGSLFKETEKKSDKHPDYKGKAMIGGVLYYVSGWKKESANGTTYVKTNYTPANGGGARRDADEF